MTVPGGQPPPPASGDRPRGDEGEAGRKDRDGWSFLQKLLALLTALLTFATAGLGLWGAQAKAERDDLQERNQGLEREFDATADERDQLEADLEEAQARIDELEESPRSSGPTSTTSTTGPLGGPVTSNGTYLSELVAVDGNWSAGELKIDGNAYLHGVTAPYIDSCGSGDLIQEVEYSIDRGYTSLSGVVGVSDDSASGLPIGIEITGDGRSLWNQSVQVGQPQSISLDVTDILRLKVIATKQFDVTESCPAVYPALGDLVLE